MTCIAQMSAKLPFETQQPQKKQNPPHTQLLSSVQFHGLF